jgi:hypothetical protein
MEEAPENGKESLHSAHGNGIEWNDFMEYFNGLTHVPSFA